MLKCLVICDDEACTCCQDVLAIREQSNTMEWMDTQGFKNINKPYYPAGYVTNDNICAIKKALLQYKSIKGFNICAAHVGSIPKDTNLWLKYFMESSSLTKFLLWTD